MNKYLIFISATFVLSLGCDGCSETEKKVEDKIEKKVEAPKKIEDPLKDAKKDADERGTLAGVAVSDLAQSLAADIEGAKKLPIVKKRKNGGEKETGKLPAADLNKVFRLSKGAMRKCYERQLKGNPSLRGRVRLSVKINSSGKVSSASASGLSGKVHSCMVREAKLMRFPKPVGGAVRVSKPYNFKPDS